MPGYSIFNYIINYDTRGFHFLSLPSLTDTLNKNITTNGDLMR